MRAPSTRRRGEPGTGTQFLVGHAFEYGVLDLAVGTQRADRLHRHRDGAHPADTQQQRSEEVRPDRAARPLRDPIGRVPHVAGLVAAPVRLGRERPGVRGVGPGLVARGGGAAGEADARGRVERAAHCSGEQPRRQQTVDHDVRGHQGALHRHDLAEQNLCCAGVAAACLFDRPPGLARGDRDDQQRLVLRCGRAGTVDEFEIGRERRMLAWDADGLGEVAAHHVGVLGDGALDPLQPVHGGGRPGEPGEDAAPRGQAALLLGRVGELEGTSPYGEHRGVGAGSTVVEHADRAAGSDDWRGEQPYVGQRRRWVLDGDALRSLTEQGSGRQVAVPAAKSNRCPPRQGRHPLLDRSPANRPERQPSGDAHEPDGQAEPAGAAVDPDGADRGQQRDGEYTELARTQPDHDRAVLAGSAELVAARRVAHRGSSRSWAPLDAACCSAPCVRSVSPATLAAPAPAATAPTPAAPAPAPAAAPDDVAPAAGDAVEPASAPDATCEDALPGTPDGPPVAPASPPPAVSDGAAAYPPACPAPAARLRTVWTR